MKNTYRYLTLAVLVFFVPFLARALDVTVHNENLGVVREVRTFNLDKSQTVLQITDVPSQIDPTSVHFKSLTDPDGTTVLEQNYEFDLISQDKILEKYIGKEIELETVRGQNGDKRDILKGILLSNSGGRVLKVGKQIYVNPSGNPILQELPEGLVTKPTLVWHVAAKKPGLQKCELTYMTGGLSWQADYIIIQNAQDDRMDLNSWVTLTNTSGGAYKDAKLKLVAGNVNRASEPKLNVSHSAMLANSLAMEDASAGFAEKSFFEYHLYTLGRTTTIKENEVKQIELANAADIPMKKNFVYEGAANDIWYSPGSCITDAGYGTGSDKNVWVFLEFKNSKESNLGFPLPKGRVRVYKKDTDDSLQLIGEDNIDHTPKDETVRIKMGQAFDIVGERKRTDFRIDNNKRQLVESFEIELRNHKEEAVTVHVVEHLNRWSTWKIIESDPTFKKKDAQTIDFTVPVSKDETATVRYTVRYSW